MGFSNREKWISFITLAFVGIFLLDRYVLTPFMERLNELDRSKLELTQEMQRGRNLLKRRRKLSATWKKYQTGGLHSDPAQIESKLLHSLQEWSEEAAFALTSMKPNRPRSLGALGEVVVHVAGKGTMKSTTRLLWHIQQSRLPVKMSELQLRSADVDGEDLSLSLSISALYLANGDSEVASSGSEGSSRGTRR